MRLSTIRVRLSSGDRAPLVLFGGLAIASVPLLVWFGRGGWFAFDDWDLLAQRTGGNLGDLFRPHYEHWLTLPVLVYRLLWQLFGIRTYVPYQLLSILVHVTAATLLLVVMRRAGVSAWLSTIFASVFLFFGSGAYNILFAFQITFVGSLVFGLTQLMLADHDGPVDRRDWLGLLAGLAGMLCSGIAVTMVIVVGLAALIRRGWRIALFHTAPLAGVYLLWLAIIGRETQHAPFEHLSVWEVVRFIAVGLRAAFGGLGQLPGAGLALALVLLTGLAVAFGQLGRPRLPLAAQLPRSVEPDHLRAEGLTIGWLIDGVHAGRVSPPPPVAAKDVATETLRLALLRTDAARAAPCSALPGPVVRVLRKGQSITLKTATATVVYLPPASASSRPIVFSGSKPLTLRALAGPLRLRVVVPAGVVACG